MDIRPFKEKYRPLQDATMSTERKAAIREKLSAEQHATEASGNVPYIDPSRNRQRSRRKSGQRWLSIAAASIAIIGTGAGIWQLSKQSGTHTTTKQPTVNPTNTQSVVLGRPLGQSTVVQMADEKSGWILTTQSTFGHLLHTDDGARQWMDVTPTSPLSPSQASVQLSDVVNGSVAIVSISDIPTGQKRYLFLTTNGGQRWSQLQLPSSVQGDTLSQVQFVNAKVGWIIMTPAANGTIPDPVILRTVDGGQHFTVINTANVPSWPTGKYLSPLSPISGQTAWISVVDNNYTNARVYVTKNGGQSWSQVNMTGVPGRLPQQQLGISSVSFLGPKRGVIVEAWPQLEDAPPTKVMVLTTSDGGSTWKSSAALKLPTKQQVGMAAGIQVIGPKDVVVISGSTVYHTKDGGHHWTHIHNSSTVPQLWQVHFTSDNIAYGSQQGYPVVSTDGGKTWHWLTGAVSDASAAKPPTPNKALHLVRLGVQLGASLADVENTLGKQSARILKTAAGTPEWVYSKQGLAIDLAMVNQKQGYVWRITSTHAATSKLPSGIHVGSTEGALTKAYPNLLPGQAPNERVEPMQDGSGEIQFTLKQGRVSQVAVVLGD